MPANFARPDSCCLNWISPITTAPQNHSFEHKLTFLLFFVFDNFFIVTLAYACLLLWKTNVISQISIKNFIRYPKHSRIHFLIAVLFFYFCYFGWLATIFNILFAGLLMHLFNFMDNWNSWTFQITRCQNCPISALPSNLNCSTYKWISIWSAILLTQLSVASNPWLIFHYVETNWPHSTANWQFWNM